MKAAQSSIYRSIENVMIWFIPVSARVPKIIALRCLTEECTININDALTSVALGLQSENWNDVRDCIDVVLLHMTMCENSGEGTQRVF